MVKALLVAGSFVCLLAAVTFVWAGIYEMVRGKPAEGVIGRGFFPRNGARRSDSWEPRKWRTNGYQVTVMGGGFLVLTMWLAVGALRA
jgi:hypothetical protein